MLVCAGVSPHPPIIIPEIGGDELQKAKSTVTAMREWAAFMTEQRPEVLVFISPHGVFTRRQMGYLQTQDLFGDFTACLIPLRCHLQYSQVFRIKPDSINSFPGG
jgi:aromatic ring-opening dioxygenase LigB subunit